VNFAGIAAMDMESNRPNGAERMEHRGKAWKYGDDVDTDVIIPARYLNTSDPAELAKHCMEDIDRGYASKVSPGDFIVAGKNFGCGSSREHAPIAIKASGARAVIARSFARIFYRNSFNMGLPIFEAPDAIDGIEAGDVLALDMERGTLRNETKREHYKVAPVPPFMRELVAAGGLLNYMAARRKGK
jgi:3-isopropylmalate dehydrogenase/3-isopropylmalate/(R)-2-methylmalate dehydratase small subunit